MLPYIKIYPDFIDVVQELDNGARGRLFLAIMQYANGDETAELTGAERIAFIVMKGQIDRDATAYEANAKKQSENGRKGGRPKKSMEAEKPTAFSENPKNPPLFLETHSNPKKPDKEKDKDKEKDYDKDESIKKAPRRFAPPSVEEVVSYCRERKNGVDAQRFVDFYASKGWKVGNNPMKDWKAAVRTWEGRDKETQAASAKGIMQHTPTPAKPDLDNLKAIYERVKNG